MRYWTTAFIAITTSVALASCAWPTAAILFPSYWAALAYVLLQFRDILRLVLLSSGGGILLLAWYAQRLQTSNTRHASPSATIVPFSPRPTTSPNRRAA